MTSDMQIMYFKICTFRIRSAEQLFTGGGCSLLCGLQCALDTQWPDTQLTYNNYGAFFASLILLLLLLLLLAVRRTLVHSLFDRKPSARERVSLHESKLWHLL